MLTPEVSKRTRSKEPWTKEKALAAGREWNARNKEKRSELNRRGTLKKYGITPDQYDSMLTAQGGGCALCREPPTQVKGRRAPVLHVDHNHSTGAARALLCHGCNTALGLLKESPALLERAAQYLRDHNARLH